MGLFFKCLPQQTLCRKGERCTGGKLSKERLTVMHAFRIPGHTSDTLPDCARNEGEDCLQMESDEARLVLSALQAHNTAADLSEFAAADDNLCVCREDTLDDLVAEVLPAQYSSESEEESEEQSSVTAAQAFHYLAEVRKFLTVEENSQEQLAALNGIENFVLNAHARFQDCSVAEKEPPVLSLPRWHPSKKLTAANAA
nr:uncharacterized protein LOC129380872 [Dermacentor andersoni]